jgi:hypothetical protein
MHQYSATLHMFDRSVCSCVAHFYAELLYVIDVMQYSFHTLCYALLLNLQYYYNYCYYCY